MKHTKIFALLLALVMVLALAACGEESSSSESSSSGSSTSSSAGSSGSGTSGGVADGYTLTLDGVKIEMEAPAEPIVEELGEPKDFFESESCAFEGLDKEYTYSGFKLKTYPVDDVDYVSSVVFMDDTISTDEGITIGSTLEEVVEAYGEDYTEKGSSLTYTKSETSLIIGLQDDKVATLEVDADVE
ncbi:MAG: hypothetical protein LUC17_00180 [Oscillospiraceae bacterium]|nr:hypothetical protein [Oscillospiraceae bacterium]